MESDKKIEREGALREMKEFGIFDAWASAYVHKAVCSKTTEWWDFCEKKPPQIVVS